MTVLMWAVEVQPRGHVPPAPHFPPVQCVDSSPSFPGKPALQPQGPLLWDHGPLGLSLPPGHSGPGHPRPRPISHRTAPPSPATRCGLLPGAPMWEGAGWAFLGDWPGWNKLHPVSGAWGRGQCALLRGASTRARRAVAGAGNLGFATIPWRPQLSQPSNGHDDHPKLFQPQRSEAPSEGSGLWPAGRSRVFTVWTLSPQPASRCPSPPSARCPNSTSSLWPL